MQGYIWGDSNPIYFCVSCFKAAQREMIPFSEFQPYDGGNDLAQCVVCCGNLALLSNAQVA